MSELPERKVLKNILSKLKAKTISSFSYFKQSYGVKQVVFEKILNEAVELKSQKEDESSKYHYDAVMLLHRLFEGLSSNALNVVDDFLLYVESLESYSAELDKTLWDAIEQAKKEAEEQIKKQEELMKRKSPESYIK